MVTPFWGSQGYLAGGDMARLETGADGSAGDGAAGMSGDGHGRVVRRWPRPSCQEFGVAELSGGGRGRVVRRWAWPSCQEMGVAGTESVRAASMNSPADSAAGPESMALSVGKPDLRVGSGAGSGGGMLQTSLPRAAAVARFFPNARAR